MYWIIFHTDQLLLQDGALPKGEVPPIAVPEGEHVHVLPDLDGEPCRAFEYRSSDNSSVKMQIGDLSELLSGAITPELQNSHVSSFSFIGLRASYDVLPLSHYLMAGKAHELIHFNRTVRFCSVCGAPMRWHTDISKQCSPVSARCGRQ